MSTVKAAAKPVTIGKAIDTLWSLREKKRDFESQLKLVEADISAQESIIFDRLAAEDTTIGKGTKAQVSVVKVVNYNIEDFGVFCKYIQKTKYFHLFQRRVSVTAAREIFEQKGAVPGLTPFIKQTLSLKSL